MGAPIEIRGAKNLGLVRAIQVGVNPPFNKKILWFDDNSGQKIHKYFNFQEYAWKPLAGGDGAGSIVWNFVVPFGDFVIYKNSTNTNPILEIGDVVNGWLSDGVTFIPFGKYLGGDVNDISSWSTSPIDFS